MSNRRKTRAMCPCYDCGWPTVWRDRPCELYMVQDELWAQAGMDPLGGWLCVGCLERRIGRQLTPADFDDVPANDPEQMRHTDRLVSRITGERKTAWICGGPKPR